LRAQRHTDSDLADLPRDVVRHRSVEPHARDQESENRETRTQFRERKFPADRPIDFRSLCDHVGDGYGPQVEADLKGKAYVGRMATSKSLGDPALLDEVALVLQEQAFDVIHFNNGMHGAGYSEEEYAAALPALLATLRRYAPNAKLIWASTTDVRQRNHLETADPKTDRIVQRNRAAAAIVQKENIPTDDLFSLVRGHPDYHAEDGVHFSDKGSGILAAQVSDSIAKLLH
jgi:lysophospholipase L1-like esterase